jgi:hypothetical protein
MLVDRRNHHYAELEPGMNPIEKVMTDRSSHVKLALAVVALVLVLWATGSPLPSLWITAIGTRAHKARGRKRAQRECCAGP